MPTPGRSLMPSLCSTFLRESSFASPICRLVVFYEHAYSNWRDIGQVFVLERDLYRIRIAKLRIATTFEPPAGASFLLPFFSQSSRSLHNSALLPSALIHCAAYIRLWWLMDGDRASRSGWLVKSSVTCRRITPQIERRIAASHPSKRTSLFPPSQRVLPFSKRCSLSLVSVPSTPKMSTKKWADGPYKLLSTPRAALKVKILQNIQ
jgi:hypothetical protein